MPTAVDSGQVELGVVDGDLRGGHAEQRDAVVAHGGLLVIEVRLGVEVLDLPRMAGWNFTKINRWHKGQQPVRHDTKKGQKREGGERKHARTSAPIWQGKRLGSKPWMRSTPVLPSISDVQKASFPMPIADTGPRPVTTTCG